MVCNGAGAAAIACVELVKAMGVRHENVILCDTKGVIYQGRERRASTSGNRPMRSRPTPARLADACEGADVFFGLSVKGALTPDMVQIHGRQSDHLRHGQSRIRRSRRRRSPKSATTRSWRPAGRTIRTRSTTSSAFPTSSAARSMCGRVEINEEMKAAAARALAELAARTCPTTWRPPIAGNRPKFGPGYIIPVPFDPRLISAIPVAVAKAAMESGVAGRAIEDFDAYARQLSARRDPIASTLQRIYERVRRHPKRIVFTEGEEEQVMRAAVSYVNQELGTAILLGREEQIRETAKEAGVDLKRKGIEIINARLSSRNGAYADFLYERLQRDGYLFRDCQRLINNDRNHFAATMVALGDADGVVTGVSPATIPRHCSTMYAAAIDAKPGHRIIGVSLALCRGRTVLVADTAVHDMPTCRRAGRYRRRSRRPWPAAWATSRAWRCWHISTFGHPPERTFGARAARR